MSTTAVVAVAVAAVVCLVAIISFLILMNSMPPHQASGTGPSLTTGPFSGAYTKPYTGTYPTWLDSSFLKSTLGGGIRPVEYRWNVAQIGANTAGPLDCILYGDSITAFIHEDPKKQAAFTDSSRRSVARPQKPLRTARGRRSGWTGLQGPPATVDRAATMPRPPPRVSMPRRGHTAFGTCVLL